MAQGSVSLGEAHVPVGEVLRDLRMLKNPLAVLYGILRRRSTPVRLRRGDRFTLPGSTRIGALKVLRLACSYGATVVCPKDWEPGFTWAVDPVTRTLRTPSGIRFYHDSIDTTVFAETFINEIHNTGSDLTDKVVFDVGGFVGDTALYYAAGGAKVHTFEPDPENCAWLIKNVALNPELGRRIYVHNVALGSGGPVKLQTGRGSGSGVSGVATKTTTEVKSLSLNAALESTGEVEPFLLKLDCKGCEVNLVQQEAVRKFQRVFVEYTYLPPSRDVSGKAIMEALRNHGFRRIRVYRSDPYPRPDPLVAHGMVDASR